MRDAASLSLEAVAAQMPKGWDDTKLSRVENGRRIIRSDDLPKLLAIYGITDPEVVIPLQGLARDAHKIGHWWSLYGDAVPSAYDDYLWLETDALELRANSPKIITGLLQTPAYAREIIAATAVGSTQADIDARAEIRKTRQAVLTYRAGRPPLRLWAVIHESALRQRSNRYPHLMRDQIAHLLELAELPNVTIQVMRDDAEANPGMVNAFDVVRFPAPWPTVINVEHFSGGSLFEEEADVTMYETAFDLTVAAALPVDASKARMQEIKDGKA
jgi:hypothetical protein